MNNSDVLWAWVAGVAVSLALLAGLSGADGPPPHATDGHFTLPEMGMGASGWDYEAWERTGGTPPRPESGDALARALDLLEGAVPAADAVLPDGDMADTDTGGAETQ
ncbi:hypothetical protein JJL56_06615 [Azospirillum sp. YIM DDC1]|uniref:Uncharacterized protein n=1 Tax=Azospirillum aestuarii TaxID=2802052 RepID=A0ABS1HUN6_9PROT|nr:hypothetical protein [Azospirillum aestuarii]MBK3777486.1 hypothetical protein [Azospirillum brasilense]MBK4718535.1 hypothetical protein [Azospirillum aestuarii]TWA95155.1 hypothetical protein FBY14_101393 [Azospirillum brasilense]